MISSNRIGGIYFSSSTGNLIYHNDIIDNPTQGYDDGINFWDNGYPSGGNHWSDYIGVDDFSGPNQDIPGSDGIGDTNYTNIESGNNVDNYPLMDPIGLEFTNFTIILSEGWNLISIPLYQNIKSIDKVLENITGRWDHINTYDASDPDHWKSNATFKPDQLNDLKSLNHKIGFWIHITTPNVNLTVKGYKPTSTCIFLHSGWNLVGYPAVNDTLYTVGELKIATGATRVEGFNTTAPYRISELTDNHNLKKGEGYWVHVPADSVWVVNW